MKSILFFITKSLNLIIFSFCFISCEGASSINKAVDLKETNAMQLGVKLIAPTPHPEIYFDDLIHPCIRYIPGGFSGHDWWMVASPYRGSNPLIENPILFFGDSRVGGFPPLTWTAVGVIEEIPSLGYNSDPNIYFDGTKLWVFWRENGALDCSSLGYTRGVFGKSTTDGFSFGPKKFFAGEVTGTVDSEMCPIIVNFDGQLKLYAVHHTFTPTRLPLGISIWDIENNNLEKNQFTKTKDVLPVYKTGFDFWHFDVFKYKLKYYCVVTPEVANEILLGQSDDGENFIFWDKPLLSSNVTGRSYFYKPSAMVHDGIFYLWYPVAELGVMPRTSRIWMSEINFDDLIRILEKGTTAEAVIPQKTNFNENSDVFSTKDGIIIKSEKSIVAYIYTSTGILVNESLLKIGTNKINLKAGFYLVSRSSKLIKIMVK